jgi:hypothetical protein
MHSYSVPDMNSETMSVDGALNIWVRAPSIICGCNQHHRILRILARRAVLFPIGYPRRTNHARRTQGTIHPNQDRRVGRGGRFRVISRCGNPMPLPLW